MTEAEWLAGDDPTAMLRSLRGRATARRYRLFAAACAWDELAHARRTGELFHFGDPAAGMGLADIYWDPVRGYEAAVRAAEAHADGGRTQMSFWYVNWFDGGGEAAFAALGHDPDDLVCVPPERIAETVRHYTAHPSHYLRCLFGNPFRPVTLDPGWRTSAVVALAEGVYADRAWDRLPVLADALEDAGRTNADVIGHLRGPGPHARGCWVVDLLLGKT